jgi:hypothetical protein
VNEATPVYEIQQKSIKPDDKRGWYHTSRHNTARDAMHAITGYRLCHSHWLVFRFNPEHQVPAEEVAAPHQPGLLTTDKAARKAMPIATGVVDYFPLALAEVARVSKAGNDQHNPGQPLHWDKTKSMDHADCIGRHLIERGRLDDDGMRHSAKLAWRALALLQIELEQATAAK